MRNYRPTILICGLLFALSTTTVFPEDGYHSYQELTRALQNLEKSHPNLVQLQSIGKTRENRDIWLVRVSNEQKGNPDEKSALFLCGNIEGDHLVGSEAVLATIQYLLNNYGKDEKTTQMLDQHVCYFVPRVSPDASEHFFAKIKTAQRTNLTPTDEDDDGFVDEDPPEDLNGDGFITQMRVRDPEGTYFPDPDETRILKKADPAKGEEGLFTLYTEGIDNDHDGKYNEDPIGGVNIDRNFPHNYPYFEKDAGQYMTSESETRALINFLLEHRNVSIVLAYSVYDNLINTPKPSPTRPAAQPTEDESDMRRFFMARKAETTINKDDLPYFQKISEDYKNIVGTKSGKQNDASEKPEGAFFQWAYFQYGVLACSTPIWQLPEIKAEKDTSAAPKRPPSSQGEKKIPSDDVKWLQWIDKTQNGVGFVPWEKYTHPTLGEVEIGGFDPFIRTNPPKAPPADILEKHTKFVVSLGQLFPRIEIQNLTITKKADSIYEIECIIQNKGYLPTALEHGARARAVKPIVARLDGANFEILAGNKLEFVNSLPGSGGTKKWTWMIKAKSGTSLSLLVNSEKAGNIVEKIVLK